MPMQNNKTGTRHVRTGLRHTAPTCTACLATLVVAQAGLAQAPSFTTVPSGLSKVSSAKGVSPNGRYVAGYAGTSEFTGFGSIYRWDRVTGIYSTKSSAFEGYGRDNGGPLVINSGAVFSTRTTNDASTLYVWQPDTGGGTTVPSLLPSWPNQFFSGVSTDGLFIAGEASSTEGRLPQFFVHDSSLPVQVVMDSNSEAFRARDCAGITQPINGLRFMYATQYTVNDVGPDRVVIVPRAVRWQVGSAIPIVESSFSEFLDVSPRGEYLLGRANNQSVIRGDGADRVLLAPISPVIMSSPFASRMSDDARVAVGIALDPLSNQREAVVWRKGQSAATLRTLLTSAGVSMPAWAASTLQNVSADGSVVTGMYFTAQEVLDNVSAISPRGSAFVAVLPSLNDNCATARPVTYGTVTDTTNGATRGGVSAGNTCSDEQAAPDVWFSFVPAANELVTIDTCGSDFDTTLSIFAASTCGAVGAPLACNDDANPSCPSGNAAASRLSANVVAGQNYYVRVSGFRGAFGTVQLTISSPNRPSNDTCATAISVGPGAAAVFSTANAITDARPNCAGSATPFSDVWFKTVPMESGRMVYRLCNSSFNAVVSAFDGSACGDASLLPLACTQNNVACGSGVGTSITVPCTANQPQLIRVGGLFGATGSGLFSARFACDQNNLSPYAVAVRNDNPRAYWRFEDTGQRTVADTMRFDPFSCGDYPGEYLRGATRVQSFQANALSLNRNGAVRADVVPQLRAIADIASCPNSTLEAWVRTTDPYAGVVLTNRGAPGEYSTTLMIGYNPLGTPGCEGRVMFVSDGPGTLFGAMSNVRVDDGRWHHIAAVRTRVEIIPGLVQVRYWVYVDGDFQFAAVPGGQGTDHSGTNGQYWHVGDAPAWTGIAGNGAGPAFNGEIDEVALYCSELQPSQISNHFRLGAPPTCDSIDFNRNGLFPEDQDLIDFLSVLAGGTCSNAPNCADIDFNNDGLFPDDSDIIAFLRVLAGGTCE